MKSLAPLVLLAALAGCATQPPAPPPPEAGKPRVALVLGGGAVRGFAHIGVIKLLDIMEIRPDLIVGTSAGSVAGVLFASGIDGFRLQEMAWELDQSMVTDWSVFGKGLIRGQALENYINRAVEGRTLERLKRRFACVATRLSSGEAVLFQSGNPGRAVRASSSVPGVFEPVRIDKDEYVDGGLVSPVPVRFARELGADFVIAVDVASAPLRESHNSTLDVMLKSYTIMGQTIRAAELPLADIVITPQLDKVDSTDFAPNTQAIIAGARAALAAMPEIRAKLAAWTPPAGSP
ncbi:MAG: patatin-like phospholipase family protein [Gammaproteobacteria bacterium]